MDFEHLRQALIRNRSVRRFDHSQAIDPATLMRLVELTRYCPSGRNAQMLRYRLVTRPEELEQVYHTLKWAGYYADWDGPEPAERPTAYLVQCLDTRLGANCLCDDGLQLMALTLGAQSLGLSACIIKAFDGTSLAAVLRIPARYKPNYVLALGRGVERVVIEDMPLGDEGDFRYFRTPDGTHHVPKRRPEDLVIDTDEGHNT